MFLFSRLSVRTKILLIPVIGAIGFATYLLLSIQSSSNTAIVLEQTRTVRVPTLQIADRVGVSLERLTEGLASAATASDPDMIRTAEAVAEGIKADLAKLPRLDSTLDEAARELERSFTAYADTAIALSADMVSGDVDFSTVGERSRRMSTRLDEFRGLVGQLQASRQAQFEAALNRAEAGTQALITRGIVLGGTIIVLLFAVAVPVAVTIKGSLTNVIRTLRNIGQENGDLTIRLEKKSQDEFGELVDCFNQFVEKLHETISSVVAATDPVAQASQNVRTLSADGHSALTDQRARAVEASASVQEMSASSSDIARNANQAAAAAELALKETANGDRAVSESMAQVKSLAAHLDAVSEVISRVEKDSENITSVVKIIRDVADQTNLLALDAAIESARAGEHGRGFAVVADEVRGLAGKTQQSTATIVESIKHLTDASNEAVLKAREANALAVRSVDGSQLAGETLNRIRASIETITDMNVQIAAATEQQLQVTASIVNDVAYIEEKAETTAENSGNLTGVSQNLADSVQTLRSIAARFRL